MDNPMYEKRMLITKFTQKYLANPLIPVRNILINFFGNINKNLNLERGTNIQINI